MLIHGYNNTSYNIANCNVFLIEDRGDKVELYLGTNQPNSYFPIKSIDKDDELLTCLLTHFDLGNFPLSDTHMLYFNYQRILYVTYKEIELLENKRGGFKFPVYHFIDGTVLSFSDPEEALVEPTEGTEL